MTQSRAEASKPCILKPWAREGRTLVRSLGLSPRGAGANNIKIVLRWGFSTAFLQMCPFWVVVLIKVSSSQRGYAVVFSEGAQFSQGIQQKFHFESDKWSSLGGHVSEVGRS